MKSKIGFICDVNTLRDINIVQLMDGSKLLKGSLLPILPGHPCELLLY
jgi:hypothetical protein